MNLLPSRFLRRCGATFGRSASCCALCLALLSAFSSSAADSLTQADAALIQQAVIGALQSAPISFNQGAVNTVPWLFPNFQAQTLGEWLIDTFVSSSGSTDNFYEMLRGLLQTLNEDTASIDLRLETGLLTGAQREQLMTWLSDIQMWGEVSATANGYRTYSYDNALLAWSVRDDDLNNSFYAANGKLDDILAAIHSPGNWDGLEQIISGGIYNAGQDAKDSADIPDQTALARNALGDVRSIEHAAQTDGEEAESDAKGALDSLIGETEFPFLGEQIPLLNDIDAAPTRTISRPDTMPYLEDWVLVAAGFRLVDEETPGSIPLPEIALKRSATVTQTSRPYIEWGGRITSALWALAFGVWILHVARSDWAFYTSGGGSDASMLAEQMEARRCLDLNAALFSDSSLL